jgi:hypothetical protein
MRTSTKRAPVLGVFAIIFAMASALMLISTAAEAAPRISGTPPASIRVNAWYSFVPTASDPAVSTSSLRFSIINKPWWAKFSVYTGRLEGRPTVAGRWGNIQIKVTSRTGTASLPAFAITASTSGGTTTNQPPAVSGAPATSVMVGSAYSFTPTGRDPEGRTLVWSISNLPRWATFSTVSGALRGTPSASHVGTYSNIVITASDGTNRRSLPAFSIAVNASGTASGSATLSWTPPTRNTNGSTLTNLAGYRIYYGTSPTSLTRTVQLSNAGLSRYVVSNLGPATWYFSIRSYTSSGAESTNSNTVSKVIR